MYGIPI